MLALEQGQPLHATSTTTHVDIAEDQERRMIIPFYDFDDFYAVGSNLDAAVIELVQKLHQDLRSIGSSSATRM